MKYNWRGGVLFGVGSLIFVYVEMVIATIVNGHFTLMPLGADGSAPFEDWFVPFLIYMFLIFAMAVFDIVFKIIRFFKK